MCVACRPFSRRAAPTTAVSDAAKAARTAAEAAEAAQEPTHVHTYLLYVLGSAMGLKAACTMQRVLVYTREHHEHKAFFALARYERQGWHCGKVSLGCL